MRPRLPTAASRYLKVGIFLVLAAAVERAAVLAGAGFLLTQLTMAAYYTLVAVGLSLLMGYAGQISLGHAGFFAIGGYTSAALTTWDLSASRGDTLVLGPFRGPDSPHHRIKIGTDGVGSEGICGWVAAHGVPQVIPDVNADPRYLACSAVIQSEIVVPILKDGEVVGVLDLDSPILGRFDDEDRAGLESLVAVFVERTDLAAS